VKTLRTAIPDILVIEPTLYSDERGWFHESFSEPALRSALYALGLEPPGRFVQDNHSRSKRGVLRGLHYQLPPHAQAKLVRVVRGAAFDVAVDIRRESPTFKQWVGIELSESNRRQMWIPEGFAHGFLALEDDTDFLYKTTDVYAKACERAICWNDPEIGIEWPLKGLAGPILAPKDAAAQMLGQADLF
jgi:dTDP-4-dehydrorhamnose 3,5-epimerase